ncbi:MAG: hypothetical protein DYG89_27525 [Caldilinea sp. CFX5]|nr:hypothetical protein [Caldilinea sp. CFX5]
MAALAISPAFQQDGIGLAATAAGLYRSTDGGQQWRCVRSGLADPRIMTVAFAPRAPLAFAATADGRLFQSEDGGTSWQEVTGWAGFGLINAIAPSPDFAADQTLFVATNEGVFRSQDGGASWASSTFGLLDLEILCLACAPNFAENELLWAGSALGGLYRSRNGARSWRDSGQGLPDMAIQCLAVSPNFAVDQTLYVGTESDGLYRSTDGGASWQAVAPELAGQSINAVAVSVDGQTLLVGGSNGVYRAVDGGQQWRQPGGDAFVALTLALAPNGLALAGAYQDGIFALPVGREPWQTASNDLAAHAPPSAFFAQDGTIYLLDVAGAFTAYQTATQSWRALNQDLAEAPVLAAAIGVSAQSDLLYAVTATTLYYAAVNRQWHSASLPEQSAPPALLAAVPAVASRPMLLLADTASNLFASDNDGAQWTTLNAPWSNSQLLQLGFAPTTSVTPTIYALTAQPHAEHNYLLQLWHSSDGGNAWLALADFYADTPAAVLAVPPDPHERALLVGVRNRLIKLYQASGSHDWAVTQHFLADRLRITSIVTTGNYAVDGVIYITSNQGVLQSQDGGATWTPVGEGLAERTIVAFQPAMNGRPAYAVELGGVIWQQ